VSERANADDRAERPRALTHRGAPRPPRAMAA
jgi:hypothetical protein